MEMLVNLVEHNFSGKFIVCCIFWHFPHSPLDGSESTDWHFKRNNGCIEGKRRKKGDVTLSE